MKKKKFIITLSAVVLLAIAGTGIVLHHNAAENSTNAVEEAQLGASGKHCNGSVGCDCRGFKPITDGAEWQKSYCDRCGHHKRNHR